MKKKIATHAPSDEVEQKPFIITGATLKDGFCHYSYEIATGVTKGDELNRRGSLIIHDDMVKAFKKLPVHLAAICEELDNNKIRDVEHIDDWDADTHKEGSLEHKVSHFHVHSFAIAGNGENEGVVLTGTKRLSTDEVLKLTSPPKKFSGDYQFINELKVAIDDIIIEVEEYMKGKSKPVMVQAAIPGLDEEE